jgi:hypothetical protein
MDRRVTVSLRVARVLASKRAGLQIYGQSTFIGDIVEPVTKLMSGDPANGAITFPNIEPLESGPEVMPDSKWNIIVGNALIHGRLVRPLWLGRRPGH